MATHIDELKTLLTLEGDDAYAKSMRAVGGAVQSFGARHRVALEGLAFAGPYMSAAGDAALNAGVSWIKSAGDLSSVKTAYRGLLKDDALANSFVQQMQQFAAATPFEFMDLTRLSKQMLAFGFTTDEVLNRNGDQWGGMVNTIGNAVGMLGGNAETITRMVRAFGQMRAKGKPTMQDLYQVAETGVPVFDILSEKLKMSRAEIMNLAKSGVSAEQVIQALLSGMEDRYAGGMEAQSKELVGVLSNLEDAKEQMRQALGEGMLPTAIGSVKGVTALTEVVRDLPKPMRDAIGAGTMLTGGILKVGGAFGNVARDAVSIHAAMNLARAAQVGQTAAAVASAPANAVAAGAMTTQGIAAGGAAAGTYTLAGSLWALTAPLLVVGGGVAALILLYRDLKVASEAWREHKYAKETDKYTDAMLKSRGWKRDRSGAIVKDGRADESSVKAGADYMAGQRGKEADTGFRSKGTGSWLRGDTTGKGAPGGSQRFPVGGQLAGEGTRQPNGELVIRVKGGAGISERSLRDYATVSP